jgi:hypothetical protein
VLAAKKAGHEAYLATHQLPSHWNPIDPAHGNTSLVLLTEKEHATELAQVKQHYSSTGGVGTLLSVHRVQNMLQWKRFEKKKLELTRTSWRNQTPETLIVYRQ